MMGGATIVVETFVDATSFDAGTAWNSFRVRIVAGPFTWGAPEYRRPQATVLNAFSVGA
jgi:hypothetical protein